MLEEIATIVTPDTLLRWHRRLVAEKWDYSERRAKLGWPPAIDFTTIEVWTRGGLVTYYLLFVIELASRRVHLAACTPTLGDVAQVGSVVFLQLADEPGGCLLGPLLACALGVG